MNGKEQGWQGLKIDETRWELQFVQGDKSKGASNVQNAAFLIGKEGRTRCTVHIVFIPTPVILVTKP